MRSPVSVYFAPLSIATAPEHKRCTSNESGHQVSPGAEVPHEDRPKVFVRRIAAHVQRSRLVVSPCIACSLRSGVALALEILSFAPLSTETKQ